jgi:hypothetical protein
MHRLSPLPLFVILAGALALPAGASAADCGLQAPHARAEHPIAGTKLVARDPYGGLLARNRLFFDFTVRGADADLGTVAKATWSLDGTVVHEDDKAPFEWKAQSGSSKSGIPAGDHTITVTVTPTSGAPAAVDFPLTATDCQFAGFTADLRDRPGPASLTWSSAAERGPGADLASVSATAAQNVQVALPVGLRGRAIGTLRLGTKTYTLKGAATALKRGRLKVSLTPGSRTFLKVTGLPAGTSAVTVQLKKGVAQVRHSSRYALDGGLTAAAGGSVKVRAAGSFV